MLTDNKSVDCGASKTIPLIWFIEWLVVVGLLAMIITPRFYLGGVWVYITQVISATLLVLYIYLGVRLGFFFNKSLLVPLLMVMSVIISTLHSWGFGMVPVNHRDLLYPFIVFSLYIPFFMMVPYINKESLLKKAELGVSLFFIIFLIVGILQLAPFVEISRFFIELYAYPAHVETALSGARLTLTGSDPNVGAVISVFFLLYFAIKFLNTKKVIYGFFALLSCYLLFRTQGRTAIIGLAFTFPLYFFFLYKEMLWKKIFIVLAIGIMLSLVLSQVNLFYLIEGVANALEGRNNSLNIRFFRVSYAFDNFLESPFMGWGAGLERYGEVKHLDSEYALIMQRYGIFGIAIYFFSIIYMARLGWKNKKSEFGSFLLVFLVFSLFIMMTNNIYASAQLIAIPFMLLIVNTASFRCKINCYN